MNCFYNVQYLESLLHEYATYLSNCFRIIMAAQLLFIIYTVQFQSNYFNEPNSNQLYGPLFNNCVLKTCTEMVSLMACKGKLRTCCFIIT